MAADEDRSSAAAGPIRSAFDLAQDFAEAEALSARKEPVQKLTCVDLLVIEDFGMKRTRAW